MVEPISDKPVKPALAPLVKTPDRQEQRKEGDCRNLGEGEAELRHEGDGGWRTEAIMQPSTYLQAADQWKTEGLAKVKAQVPAPDDKNKSSQITGGPKCSGE